MEKRVPTAIADEIPVSSLLSVFKGKSDEEQEVFLQASREADAEDISPIEEVNLTVPNTDNPHLPILTFRVWIIGLVICVFLAFVNQFFYFRSNPIVISALAGQIVSLYLGRGMAKWFPTKKFCHLDLNPGPFNIKEHVLITVFAGCGSAFGNGEATAMQLVTLLKGSAFFNQPINFGVALLLVITTQTLGYGIAGLLRKFLVDPPQMWWPSTMVDVSLFRALHEKEPSKGISRLQFFFIATVISFVWYTVPDYYFATMASLSCVCWIWKDSITAHQLGSGANGLGLGSIGIDWATISSYLNSPLATPWFTLVNVYVGFCIAAFVITPAFYYSNVYDARKYPIISNKLFVDTGKRYNVSMVLDDRGLYIDEAKLNDYGPPQLSTSYAIIHWGMVFAYITSAFTHVLLWHGKDIYIRFIASRFNDFKFKQDVHTRLMLRYKDVPSWWFWVLLVVNSLVSIGMVEVWRDTFQVRWSYLMLAIVMCFAFTLPTGVITATTNKFEGPGALCDFLYGYLVPGQRAGLNSFRVYAAGGVVQSVSFLRDFKLGHYMKIPPRDMFTVQVVGTVLAGFVNVCCAYWMFEIQPDLCQESGVWTCPDATNGYSIATIWGLIGTHKMFGSAGKYKLIPWMFLFGAVAPIPFWALAKSSPKLQFLKWVHLPVLFSSVKPWPPATPVNYNSWFWTGFIFQFVIFRYYRSWWTRYNYVLSAALDTGVAIAAPLIFFALQNEGRELRWWGNQEKFIDHCNLATCPTARGINVTGQNPNCPIF